MKVIELDWWETHETAGTEITAVPAQHFSARTPFDRNQTLWCGFVVRSGGVTVYFAGDSGYSPQFAEIGRRCPGIDLALLPIGAYEPRWFMQPVHVNPEEAVRMHRDVGARLSIGMHFGTFRLTDEGIDDPLRAICRLRAAQLDVPPERFRTLDFGESDAWSNPEPPRSAGVRASSAAPDAARGRSRASTVSPPKPSRKCAGASKKRPGTIAVPRSRIRRSANAVASAMPRIRGNTTVPADSTHSSSWPRREKAVRPARPCARGSPARATASRSSCSKARRPSRSATIEPVPSTMSCARLTR